MNLTEFKTMIKSVSGIDSPKDLEFNIQISAAAFLLATFKLLYFDNIFIFLSITAVVLLDWLLGTILALKNKCFETRKALKVVYYLPIYYTIAAVVLLIEKAHASAFWLSEAVIMPILIFQLISILKNASNLKVLPGKLLNTILNNIDAYKKSATDSTDSNAIK